MLDVVVNNMAWAGDHSSIDYTYLNPFHDPKYYHQYKLSSSDPSNSTCEIDVSLTLLFFFFFFFWWVWAGALCLFPGFSYELLMPCACRLFHLLVLSFEALGFCQSSPIEFWVQLFIHRIIAYIGTKVCSRYIRVPRMYNSSRQSIFFVLYSIGSIRKDRKKNKYIYIHASKSIFE